VADTCTADVTRSPLGNAAVWLVAGLLVSPWLAGLLLAPSLQGRARTIPELLFWVSLGLFPALLLGTRRGREIVHRRSGIRAALGVGLLALVAAGSIWQTSLFVADWFAPVDETDVNISAAPFGARYVRLSIVTLEGSFETPMFWTPRVEPGPARLTLGHFSQRVISID
jgi:hypothetical protein